METTPFRWEAAEPPHGERGIGTDDCRVLIVGSGYTGLSAAITFAEAGESGIVVTDAMRIGEGASSRNGGQIGNAAKFTLAQATARFGEKADALARQRGTPAAAGGDGPVRFGSGGRDGG